MERVGLMTVFAVSGSMVLLVHQVHKHLFNNFMKKFECEVLYPHQPKSLSTGSTKHKTKKVRFAEQVLEHPMEKAQEVENEKVLGMDGSGKWRRGQELKDIMPPNRVALYRGIMKYRALKGTLDF